jgi:hypothetical protein
MQMITTRFRGMALILGLNKDLLFFAGAIGAALSLSTMVAAPL